MANPARNQIRPSRDNLISTLLSGKNEDGTDFGVNANVVLPTGPTAATNATHSVTSTSSTLKAANSSRKVLYISNSSASANSVWISFEDTAVVNTGIELPKGASLVIHGDQFTGAVTAISSGTATVGTTEV